MGVSSVLSTRIPASSNGSWSRSATGASTRHRSNLASARRLRALRGSSPLSSGSPAPRASATLACSVRIRRCRSASTPSMGASSSPNLAWIPCSPGLPLSSRWWASSRGRLRRRADPAPLRPLNGEIEPQRAHSGQTQEHTHRMGLAVGGLSSTPPGHQESSTNGESCGFWVGTLGFEKP